MFESFGIVNYSMFLIGTILIIIAPGPNSLYVLSVAMRRGIRSGYQAAVAVFIGDAVLMFLAAAGVDSLFRIYPVSFSFVQYAGAAYLVYLGVRAVLTQLRRPQARITTVEEAAEAPFRRAMVLSLSNPKAILFFVSFFVQFVDTSFPHPALSFLVLASTVQVISFFYLTTLICGGHVLAGWFRGKTSLVRLANTLAGCAFIAFGCRLALSGRG